MVQKRLSRFEVTTPNFLVAVRGTAFEVSHKNESRVRVFEGVVRVNKRGLKIRPIFLRRGQQASMDRKNNQILSSNFREINRPEYSKVIFDSKNLESPSYALSHKELELKNLKKIQGQLRQSRGTGFEEFLVPNLNDSRPEENVHTNTKNIGGNGKPVLQDYLNRVANPGEDADFQIFKGGRTIQGVGKVVESWKDDYRREVQSSTLLQRQKLDGLASDFKNRRELIDEREKRLSVDLRTQVQKEDFNRRAFGRGTREVEDKNVTNREIINLRKFKNTQNLELKRIQQDQLRLVRDKELIDSKILSIEQSLTNNSTQRSSLEATLSALRIQKRQLDTVQKISIVEKVIHKM